MINFANPQEDTNALRVVLASGTDSSPSVVFANDTTKGLYWDINGLHLNGLATPVSSDEAATKDYVDTHSGGVTFPLFAPAGTVGAPSYSFSGDHTTGIFQDSPGIDVAVSGITKLVVTNVLMEITNPVHIINNSSSALVVEGTASANSPRISVQNDNSTSGQDRLSSIHALGDNGNDEITLSAGKDSSNNSIQMISGNSITQIGVGGSEVAHFDTAGMKIIDGSEGTPSISFTSTPTTGISYNGSQGLKIDSGGYSANFSPTQINFFPNNNDTTGISIAGTTISLDAGPSGGATSTEFNIDGIAETFAIHFDPSNTFAVTFDRSVTAGDTRMLLWDVTAGTLKRVTVGAADSGGVGFKVLRIPN